MRFSPAPPSSPPRSAGGVYRCWESAADADLALAAAAPGRAGQEAFVEIVRRHQAAVCAVAWSVTGRAGLRDDIAQETFFKAWKQIATLRSPTRLKAWLTRIAHDCAVDALRREKTHTRALGDPDFRPLTPGAVAADACCASASPDKAVSDAEEEALVWAALAELPENLRTPLVLFYREGQSMPAVAAALDLSEEAVRQRLSRGRQALRSAVELRIETVLGRVQPSAMLIVTIAAGIGLPSGPAAAAATAGVGAAAMAAVGGGTAVVGVTGTTGGAAGAMGAGVAGFSTFMTTTSWLAAAISLAAFLPLGWRAGAFMGPVVPDKGTDVTPWAADDPFAPYANSGLLAVWRRLHAEHGSDAAAMPLLYGLIQTEPDAFHRRALHIALMSEWSSVDPEGAYRILWSERKNMEHAGQMMREWLKRDPGTAVSHLLARIHDSEALATAAARDIAELAPAHFIAVLTALPQTGDGDNPPPALVKALHFFASRNLQTVIDALPLLKGSVLSSARTSIGPLLAGTDPAAGLKWSRSLDSENERMAAGNGVMTIWAQMDPVTALASLDSSGESRRLAATVLLAAADQDLPSALRLWRDNMAKFRKDIHEVFRPALNREFRKNPVATLELLNAQPQETRSGLAKQLNCDDLSFAATGALWDWACQRNGEGVARELCGSLLSAAFRNSHPQEAIVRLKSLPEELQVAACARAGDFIGGLGGGEFEHLLGAVPTAARPALIAAGLEKAGRESSPDVTLWRQRLEELPPASQAVAAQRFAGNLAETDPYVAVSFADSFPDGPVKDAAYTYIMGQWAWIDSWQASVWADRLPPGSARDAASAVLVRRLFDQDVDSALTWAATIGDAELRLKSLSEYVDRVSSSDPETMKAFLNNPLLSPADRETLVRARAKSNPAHQ